MKACDSGRAIPFAQLAEHNGFRGNELVSLDCAVRIELFDCAVRIELIDCAVCIELIDCVDIIAYQ